MKRLSFSFVLVIALSFIIVHSCSSEQDDTTAANVVQTQEPEPPAPTQYTLTVTAGEGGTVSTEGGTYDEGTEVTITATANVGYRFTGWEGNDSTSESLTITLNSNQTYQALFKVFTLKDRLIEIGRNVPKENPNQQVIAASSVPQEIIDEFFNVQSYLNNTIGGYDNYLMVIHDTNQNSQNILDTLSYLRYNESDNWTTVEELGLNCLTSNYWYGDGEPDLTNLCILSYEFYQNPHFDNENESDRASALYHVFAHEYFHVYQRAPMLDKNTSKEIPAWWIEGGAHYFQYLWMIENQVNFDKLTGLDEEGLSQGNQTASDSHKYFKRIFQGLEEPRKNLSPDWYFSSEQESYSGIRGYSKLIHQAFAYLVYISSPQIAMVSILEDTYDLGFENSFLMHTEMTLEEFYDSFNNYMRTQDAEAEPPSNMFPIGPMNEYVDFWNIKVKR